MTQNQSTKAVILIQAIFPGTDSEFMTIGTYIFIGMICFVVALTIGGLVYMCKSNCHCQVPDKLPLPNIDNVSIICLTVWITILISKSSKIPNIPKNYC